MFGRNYLQITYLIPEHITTWLNTEKWEKKKKSQFKKTSKKYFKTFYQSRYTDAKWEKSDQKKKKKREYTLYNVIYKNPRGHKVSHSDRQQWSVRENAKYNHMAILVLKNCTKIKIKIHQMNLKQIRMPEKQASELEHISVESIQSDEEK